MQLPVVDVAVAIVRRSDGRVLLAERTARQTGAGYWELPGGKVEPGEKPEHAAARELAEEVGVLAHRLSPAIRYEHAYRTRRVRLAFFHVDTWSGAPVGREGQRLAWSDPADLDIGPILPSNDRMLRALGLPDVYADCRPQAGVRAETQLAAVNEALTAGARLLRIGAAGLTPDQRVALARRAQALAAPRGAHLLLDSAATEVSRAGLLGIHTAHDQLRQVSVRPQVKLWIASCHNAQDLAGAIAAGADAAVISPVLADDRNPPRPALGWHGLADLVRLSNIPLYAKGGVRPESRVTAMAHGAIGVACTLRAGATASGSPLTRTGSP